MRYRRASVAAVFVASAAFLAAQSPSSRTLPLGQIKMPAGFAIEVYSAEVPGARSLELGPNGTVFVGTRSQGRVYAVADGNRDGRADRVHTIASGLNDPNGVALRDGALYVAEVSRILRFDDIERNLASPPRPAVVYSELPTEEHHGWKYLAFGPDGWLYVPVGAPCNICDMREKDDRFASILRMRPDGTGVEVYARGVRNTVGFTWHPQTGSLWFTDNGRDQLGDNVPPDELNLAPKPGMDFGYPYCHAGDLADPEFGGRRPCSDFVPPAAKFGAHVAALGLAFYTGTMFPPAYRGHLFVAQHGSWNRSVPDGYRLALVRVDGGKVIGTETFAEGWLQGRAAWGRPVDVLVMPDGALLVSDDEAGAIYRITYRG
jgi:glucose/arabinose dehydrogenase